MRRGVMGSDQWMLLVGRGPSCSCRGGDANRGSGRKGGWLRTNMGLGGWKDTEGETGMIISTHGGSGKGGERWKRVGGCGRTTTERRLVKSRVLKRRQLSERRRERYSARLLLQAYKVKGSVKARVAKRQVEGSTAVGCRVSEGAGRDRATCLKVGRLGISCSALVVWVFGMF
eukprot:755952-Hanusia_phi.AAC.5